MMRPLILATIAALSIAFWHPYLRAQEIPDRVCHRPPPGSLVPEPEDLRSHDGVLKVDLTVRDEAEPDGSARYCYVYGVGGESPNLRLNPGDLCSFCI